MHKVVQNTMISFGMLLWVLRPNDAFSFQILQQEVAGMFNTWAIFQYDKESLTQRRSRASQTLANF